MDFVETCNLDPDQDRWPGLAFAERYWLSGIYKIVYFHEHLDNRYQPVYYAYYKPKGWKNWGNRVDAAVPFYGSLEAAVAACETHTARGLAA